MGAHIHGVEVFGVPSLLAECVGSNNLKVIGERGEH
jgi:hypothetical protein